MSLGNSYMRLPYRHKETGKRYTLLAFGSDRTNCRNGKPVAIYAPNDCPFSINVREVAEFEAKFTREEDYVAAQN